MGFTYENEERVMTCLSENTFDYQEKEFDFLTSDEYTMLNLGYWGSSVDIMNNVVSAHGGWVSEKDINGLDFKQINKEISR